MVGGANPASVSEVEQSIDYGDYTTCKLSFWKVKGTPSGEVMVHS